MVSSVDGPAEPRGPARAGQHHRTPDQLSSEEEPDPQRGGRHRAPRRRRFTTKQTGDLINVVPPLYRVVEEVGKHEAPIREWFHSLTGAAQQIIDGIISLLG